MDKKYKVNFDVTIAKRGGILHRNNGDMNIDTTASLEELQEMPDFNEVVGQLLQRDHPKLNIVMVKVTDIIPLE